MDMWELCCDYVYRVGDDGLNPSIPLKEWNIVGNCTTPLRLLPSHLKVFCNSQPRPPKRLCEGLPDKVDVQPNVKECDTGSCHPPSAHGINSLHG